MKESCGGVGTYLPNYRTMQVSSTKIPEVETPFLERITNLTDFVAEKFETEVTHSDKIPEIFGDKLKSPTKARSYLLRFLCYVAYHSAFQSFVDFPKADLKKVSLAVEPEECQQENIAFIFSLEERYKRRNLHRILKEYESSQNGNKFTKTVFMLDNIDNIGRFKHENRAFDDVIIGKH